MTSASVTIRWRNPAESGGAVSYYQLQYRRSERQQEQGNTRSKREIGEWDTDTVNCILLSYLFNLSDSI